MRSFRGLDLAGVEAVACSLAAAASTVPGPLSFALLGELGAGKTAFARAFVCALPGGRAVRVQSPTYALVHHYPTEPPVRHIDLYRIESSEELEAIGFAEMVDVPGINLVEWADRAGGAIFGDRVELRLVATSATLRDLFVRAASPGADVLLEQVRFP